MYKKVNIPSLYRDIVFQMSMMGQDSPMSAVFSQEKSKAKPGLEPT